MIAVAEAVCVYCGDELTGQQKKYCGKTCQKAMWRRDPERLERDRAGSRRWKRENPDRRRQGDAAANRRKRPYDCASCGSGSATPGLCHGCQEQAAAEDRRYRIQQMWSEGLSLRAIADALDSTVGSVGVTIVRMRDAGWDLPFRYNVRPDGRRRA